MGFSVEIKINKTTLYTVYGHRTTFNQKWNNYEYKVVSTPRDFFREEPDENRVCTCSTVCEGNLRHNYSKGLLILCEKTLKAVNKQLKEREKEKENENTPQ